MSDLDDLRARNTVTRIVIDSDADEGGLYYVATRADGTTASVATLGPWRDLEERAIRACEEHGLAVIDGVAIGYASPRA